MFPYHDRTNFGVAHHRMLQRDSTIGSSSGENTEPKGQLVSVQSFNPLVQQFRIIMDHPS